MAADKHQDHRVTPLKLAQPAGSAGVIRQLVVRKDTAWDDVGSHMINASCSCDLLLYLLMSVAKLLSQVEDDVGLRLGAAN
jgi:hypothetical protein